MSKISQKQLEANRQNGRLGGVKTETGKAISKMNATKHGLLSNQVVLEDEKLSELLELEVGIKNQFLPIGSFEIFLVDRILTNMWRLRRVIKIESSAMDYERNDLDMYDEEYSDDKQKERNKYGKLLKSKKVEKIIRYESSIERGIFKSLHELQRLQAIRNGEKISVPFAVDIDISKKH